MPLPPRPLMTSESPHSSRSGQPPGSVPPGDLPAAADTSPFLGAMGTTYLGAVKRRLTVQPPGARLAASPRLPSLRRRICDPEMKLAIRPSPHRDSAAKAEVPP